MKNLSGFVLHAEGISPKTFKPALLSIDDPKLDPYFFHCGLPRNLVDGQDGAIELTDLVMSRLVRGMLEKLPALKEHFRFARWMETRFKDEPADHGLATQLDDVVGIYDHKRLKGACGILEGALRAGG
jgi:hypothetical protein